MNDAGTAVPVVNDLYAAHEKVYPRQVHGVFAAARVAAVVVLLGTYYVLPWIQYGGRQAVLFDLPQRKFHLFSITLWPQDLALLAGLLIVAALTLFFFTTLAGRLWCGYACPQTVWTETFLWIERVIEGDRAKRMRLDRAPPSARKHAAKALKHTIWIVFSLWSGFTFVGYFTPIVSLGGSVMRMDLGAWPAFWTLFYGFATYGNAGWMREQVCLYMCPYARFQSAMFDADTLIISYDAGRGEPRGGRSRTAAAAQHGLGDCVDCTLCVQVCPTGIDIRDGLQYQCIGCAACIDACDRVMSKMNYPKGLIRYTTQHALAGENTRLLRPRVVLYGVVLLSMFAALGIGLFSRSTLELDVMRDRSALFELTQDGFVENVYTLKVVNKSEHAREVVVTARGIEGIVLLVDAGVHNIPPGAVQDLALRVRAPSDSLDKQSTQFRFVVRDAATSAEVSESARFVGPMP